MAEFGALIEEVKGSVRRTLRAAELVEDLPPPIRTPCRQMEVTKINISESMLKDRR